MHLVFGPGIDAVSSAASGDGVYELRATVSAAGATEIRFAEVAT